jgi:hypothetical protein
MLTTKGWEAHAGGGGGAGGGAPPPAEVECDIEQSRL